jgi:hypothetical protein
MRRAAVLLPLLLVLALPRAAAAFDVPRELLNVAKTTERARTGARDPGVDHSGVVERAVAWTDRNGARISGHEWAPRRRPRGKPLAAVVWVNGDIAFESLYHWAAVSLARHGYVVLTWDPQGQGASETNGFGADRDRNVANEASGGTIDDAAQDNSFAEQTEDAIGFLLSSRRSPYRPARPSGRARQTQLVAAHRVEPWNPWRGLIDAKRLGAAGHSRGADAVSIVGGRDRRVKAIVAFDYLLASPAIPPRVPALNLAGDYYETVTPYTSAPDPLAKSAAFALFRKAHVDSGSLIIRGGTHFEWSFLPGLPSTLRGIDLGRAYLLAWLDRYVRGRSAAFTQLRSAAWRHDAAGARVDAAHDGNLFSFYYRSELYLHAPGPHGRAVFCPDLRARGCA